MDCFIEETVKMLTDCLFFRNSPVLSDCPPLTNMFTLDCKVVLLPILIGCSDEVGQSSLELAPCAI